MIICLFFCLKNVAYIDFGKMDDRVSVYGNELDNMFQNNPSSGQWKDGHNIKITCWGRIED